MVKITSKKPCHDRQGHTRLHYIISLSVTREQY